MLAVVGKDGELTFWSPRLDGGGDGEPWIRTGTVKTGRKDVLLATCSSRKKTAIGQFIFSLHCLLLVCIISNSGLLHPLRQSVRKALVWSFRSGTRSLRNSTLVWNSPRSTGQSLPSPLDEMPPQKLTKNSTYIHGLRLDDPIIDLDWTTTSELQSVLAIGFAHHVLLLCEQRMSYVEGSGSYWAPISKLDLSLCVLSLVSLACSRS